MSSAREYRQLLLRMGDASLAREQRKPHAREFLDTFIFGSLAVLGVVVVAVALFWGMVGGSALKGNQVPMADRTNDPGLREGLLHAR